MRQRPRIRTACWAMMVAAAAPLGPAAGQEKKEKEETADSVRAERYRLQKEVWQKLYDQLRKLREKMAEHPDLAEMRAQIDDIQKEYEAKLKVDPKITVARQAQQAAEKAYAKAQADAVANDPTLAKLRKEHADAIKAYAESRKQEAAAQSALVRARSRVRNSDAVKSLRDAYYAAERAFRNVGQTDPEILAARKAIAKVREVYEAKCKELPEYKAMIKARQAYEAKIKQIPEYAAIGQAEKKYGELRKSGKGVKAADAARVAARKAYEQGLEKLQANDPEIVALTKKSKDATATRRSSREKRYALEKKIQAAEREARTKAPAVVKAREAHEAARKALQKTIQRVTEVDQANLAKLREELGKEVAAKLAEDPKIKEIKAKMQEVQEQIRKLRTREYELRRRESSRRRRRSRSGGS